MKNFEKNTKNDIQNNYSTDFMFLVAMACVILFYNIDSHNFQYPLSFQDVTLIC